MAFQKIEFEFPDPDASVEGDTSIELESSNEVNIETLGDEKPLSGKDVDKMAVAEDDEDDEDDEVELEVIDDTPKEDQGREAAPPPDELTDEELEAYSDKVRKRIKHFNKGYHDERRAKEQAVREAQELQTLVQSMMAENNKLKESSQRDRQALLAQAKAAITGDIEKARAAYKEAYELGDSDALLTAQEKLNAAQTTQQRLNSLSAETGQGSQNGVQRPTQVNLEGEAQQPSPQIPRVQPDQKAVEWQRKNTWFYNDGYEPETAYALRVHKDLTEKEGVSPETDDYYEALNTRMQARFPELFGNTLEQGGTGRSRKSDSNVVAPATRSTAPKKVRLTKTQVALAKRLGLTPAQYAKQAAIDARNQNG